MIDSTATSPTRRSSRTSTPSIARAQQAGRRRRAVHPRRRRRGGSGARGPVRRAVAGGPVCDRRPSAQRGAVRRTSAGAAGAATRAQAESFVRMRDRRNRPRLPLRLRAARRAAGGLRGAARAGASTGLPVIIHTREATDDTFAILREAGSAAVRGVFHCFTGDAAMARRALDIGFHVSFAGHRDVSESGRVPRCRADRPGRSAAGRNRLLRIWRRCRIAASGTSRRSSRAFSRCWRSARGADAASLAASDRPQL